MRKNIHLETDKSQKSKGKCLLKIEKDLQSENNFKILIKTMLKFNFSSLSDGKVQTVCGRTVRARA